MDIAAESRRAVSELFGDTDSFNNEISHISELPGVDGRIVQTLLDNGIDLIEDFLALSQEEQEAKGVSGSEIEALRKLIEEYVEIVEEDTYEEEGEKAAEDAGEESTEPEEYECPECGAKITVDMTTCPSCGIGLSFEYEEE
jgi:N utilization substance protein A